MAGDTTPLNARQLRGTLWLLRTKDGSRSLSCVPVVWGRIPQPAVTTTDALVSRPRFHRLTGGRSLDFRPRTFISGFGYACLGGVIDTTGNGAGTYDTLPLNGVGKVSLNRAREDLAAVETEISNIKRRLDEDRALLNSAEERAGKLRATIEVLTSYAISENSSNAPVSSPTPLPSTLMQIDPSSPYYGKSLGAAAALVLAREKEPLTAAFMVQALRDEGWNFTSANPPLALYWALRDHATKTGEVVTVPGSKWALTASRPNAAHVAKSVAGLAAARARGVVLGPRRRMTEDRVTEMRKMFTEGATIAKVADKLGVSEVTIKRYRALDKQARTDGSETIADLGPNVHRLPR